MLAPLPQTTSTSNRRNYNYTPLITKHVWGYFPSDIFVRSCFATGCGTRKLRWNVVSDISKTKKTITTTRMHMHTVHLDEGYKTIHASIITTARQLLAVSFFWTDAYPLRRGSYLLRRNCLHGLRRNCLYGLRECWRGRLLVGGWLSTWFDTFAL
jgi:hypothetical protein